MVLIGHFNMDWSHKLRILSLLLVVAQLVSPTKVETASTNWIESPLPTLHGSPYNSSKSAKIRDLLNDSDNQLDSEVTKRVSPSLILTTKDTGDKTYLEKKFIKHSITELSTLSKTGRILDGRIPSCNAIKEGVKLYFPTCPGDVVVITIAGSMKMTCGEVEKRVFYGPVTIKSPTCQQSFDFEMSCEEKYAIRIKSSLCSGGEHLPTFITVIVLLCLIIIILALLMVWTIGIKRGVLINGQKLRLQRRGCYYEAPYRVHINGDGNREFSLVTDPSVLNMECRMLRKHWCVLLLLFLLCKPIPVRGFELIEDYDSAILKYNYKIIMADSEVIELGPSTIKREVVVHTSNLAYMFETASWTLDIKEEYFCQWYKCDAVSVCGMDALPFVRVGDLAQEIFGFQHVDRSYYTCQKLIGYCMFGNGCKLIAFEVIPSLPSLYSVHSLSAGGSHGGAISPPVGCMVDKVEDKSTGILDN